MAAPVYVVSILFYILHSFERRSVVMFCLPHGKGHTHAARRRCPSFFAVSDNVSHFLTHRMGPVSDMVVTTIGDSILVELGMHTGFELSVRVANDLVFDKPIKHIVPIHSKRLETTGVKVLLITLKYKHTMSDAALGFYRSSLHTQVEYSPAPASEIDYFRCTAVTRPCSRPSKTTSPSRKAGFRHTSLRVAGARSSRGT